MHSTKAVLGSAVALLMLSACSAIDPYISFREPPGEEKLNPTQPLDRALWRVREARDDMQKNARQQSLIRSASNTGILAGALATIGFASYGASRDAIVAAGLATGGSYAAGALYAPKGYDVTYRSGVRALNCVNSAVATPAARIRQIYSVRGRLNESLQALESALKSRPDANATVVLNTGNIALDLADNKLIEELPIAAEVNVAVDRIISAVNDQLASQTPDAASVIAIGQSVSTFGLTGIKASSTDKTGSAANLANMRMAGTRIQSIDPLKEMVKAVEDNTSALNAILANEQDLKKPAFAECKVDGISDTPLTASVETIPLEVNKPYSFYVSGGTQPYGYQFLGVRPTGLEVTSNGLGVFQVMGITGQYDPKTAKPATFDIYDATPNGQKHIQVKINPSSN